MMTLKSTATWAIGLVFLATLIAAILWSDSSSTTKNSATVLRPPIADYLNSFIEFAHEGYLADQIASDANSSDIASTMASMIEEINHEKSAVSFIEPYASSTDSNIKITASLFAASESDVIAKQQAGLEMLRQVS